MLASQIKNKIEDEAFKHLADSDTEGVPTSARAAQSSRNREHGELQSLFALGAEVSSSEDESCLDDCNRPTAEIQSFLKLKIFCDGHMVCEWWEGNKSQFPLLYNVAAKYLAIPATSASSERLFSKAGLTIGNSEQG